MAEVQAILSKLEKVRPAGSGKWSAQCPAHIDKKPSLSVARGDQGRVLLHCHAGCGTPTILGALGLSQRDLFTDRGTAYRPVKAWTAPGELTPDLLIQRLCERMGPTSARWEYLDAQWEPCGYILRWDTPSGKEIRPVSRGLDDRWRIKAIPRPRPLYRLPYLRELGLEDLIYLTEGEKAADALVSLGLEATTSSGGANAAKETDFSPLAGRSVVIWPDYDEAGFQYAETVASILTRLKPAAKVRILNPVHFDLSSKQDAFDFIQKGNA